MTCHWKFWARREKKPSTSLEKDRDQASSESKQQPQPQPGSGISAKIKTYLSPATTTNNNNNISTPSSKTSTPTATMTTGPRKHTVSGGKPCVVMPLYIYPLPGKDSWKPLYDAIASHPEVDFLIVVNPNSGPGDEALPSADYIREVPKLNAFENVTTVGYIAVTWARKPMDEVKAEIDRYAGWNNCAEHGIEGLYLEGIYLDETPNHVSAHAREYLTELTGYVKGLEGLRGERLVMHNPGTPPEGPLSAFGNPDIVCMSEEPNHRYATKELQVRIETYGIPRDRTLFQVSGVALSEIRETTRRMLYGPEDTSTGHQAGQGAKPDGKKTEKDMKEIVVNGGGGPQGKLKWVTGRYVFVTDLEEDFYESFGESWGVFVDVVAEACRAHEDSNKEEKSC